MKKNKKAGGFYVDGFVFVIQQKNLAAYKKMASMAGKVWKKHGALDYKECMGDDLNPHGGGTQMLTFTKLIKPKKGELVGFSYIVYKSKKHRNEVNARVMKDSMMNEEKWKDKPMPFDMKRMAYGGFKTIVSE